MKTITKGWLKKRTNAGIDERAIEKADTNRATPEEFLSIIEDHPSCSRWTQCLLLKADSEFVELFLEAGADPDAINSSFGQTALYDAVKEGQLELINQLIEYGANVNKQNCFGWTPLHSAASSDYDDIVSTLISAGARIEIADEKRNTPLNSAAANGSPDAVKLLIDEGASIHSRGYLDMTPFLSASWLRRVDCMKILIEAGSFIDVEDVNGRSWKALAKDDSVIKEIKTFMEEN